MVECESMTCTAHHVIWLGLSTLCYSTSTTAVKRGAQRAPWRLSRAGAWQAVRHVWQHESMMVGIEPAARYLPLDMPCQPGTPCQARIRACVAACASSTHNAQCARWLVLSQPGINLSQAHLLCKPCYGRRELALLSNLGMSLMSAIRCAADMAAKFAG
jgi:hypothetical protein